MMINNDSKKKPKKPKPKNSLTTNSGSPIIEKINLLADTVECSKHHHCSLIAKDSEWVDILESTSNNLNITDDNNTPDGELITLQHDDDSEIQPLTLMFPSLLQEDPETLEAIIVNKAISTTEVTKHLIGHKANFSFLKKVERLIPPDRKWLERLSERSNSYDSTYNPIGNEKYVHTCYEGRSNDTHSETATMNTKSKITKDSSTKE